MSSHPKFVVVGHPNKGKSSIVSTLTLDDTIAISNKPGTTTKSRSFKLQKGGKIFYELVDTPGFQRPRRLLKILSQNNPSAKERPKRVEEFLKNYSHDEKFKDECELLKPIMDGGGIIYVVDASKPYSSEFEAEMEILRYCAKPSMAILNYIGNEDYTKEWDAILGQYFRVVKPFNPMSATFSDHIELLEALTHVAPMWSSDLKESIKLLKEYQDIKKKEISKTITNAIVKVLSYKITKSSHIFKHNQNRLLEEFKKDIENIEKELFNSIKDMLNFKNSLFDIEGSNFEYKLFSKESFEIFGLSKEKLLLVSTLTSATAGGLIDLAVGGHSFFLGTLIGGAIGFFGANYGYGELSKIKFLGNEKIEVGPIEDENFGFIFLNRALSFAKMLLNSSHAKREIKYKATLNDDFSIKKLKKFAFFHKKFKEGKYSQEDIKKYQDMIYEMLNL
jgi:GTPase Era involved in 16S rRNA processing